MKKINFIVNIFIPVFWIIMFFIAKYEVCTSDYGAVCIFLWFALPVIMFVINTFTESRLKKLVLRYLLSTGMQIIGIYIYSFSFITIL